MISMYTEFEDYKTYHKFEDSMGIKIKMLKDKSNFITVLIIYYILVEMTVAIE